MAVRQVLMAGNILDIGLQYVSEPTVRGPVRDWIKQLGAPFRLIEIWKPLGLPRTAVNRELSRMHDAGLLTRHKIPARDGLPRHDGSYVPNDCTRMVFLYALAEGYE